MIQNSIPMNILNSSSNRRRRNSSKYQYKYQYHAHQQQSSSFTSFRMMNDININFTGSSYDYSSASNPFNSILDTFLMSFRFFGFDLCIDSDNHDHNHESRGYGTDYYGFGMEELQGYSFYGQSSSRTNHRRLNRLPRVESIGAGKRHYWMRFLTKVCLLIAIGMINVQAGIHLVNEVKTINTKGFYDILNGLRSLMLKMTMAFAVNLWYLRGRDNRQRMMQMVMENFLTIRWNKDLNANMISGNVSCRNYHETYLESNVRLLKRMALKWTFVMIGVTFSHWCLSQYWLSSLSVSHYKRWLTVVNCTADQIPEALIHLIVSLDSYVYRMYIYGSRFAAMCAYCLICSMLRCCIKELNCQLQDLKSEHLHTGFDRAEENSSFLAYDDFKRQFNVVFSMHRQIERCFGPLNLIWFATLFVVSCIDIFFLAWSAGSEWFQVWSMLEFASMVILWMPHFMAAHEASKISQESKQLKLRMKELCRESESLRKLIKSPMYYPRLKPSLNNVVTLDSQFFLSFICTLATFSVMMIQLNPEAVAKVG